MTKRQRNRAAKRAARAAEGAARKHPILFFLLIVLLVVVLAVAAYWYFGVYRKRTVPEGDISGGEVSGGETHGGEVSGGEVSGGGTPGGEVPGEIVEGELSIHFLELGNKHTGDCIFVQTGETDMLIDGGSLANSADTIENYVRQYCTDGVLEYVIVTHAHEDHIAAFAGNGSNESLFRRFECEVIIDFPRTESTSKVYGRYVEERDKEVAAGAVHYTALECYRETKEGAKRSYDLGGEVSMNFLYNYYYDHDASSENDYSVCMYLSQGKSNYLFTGDLEAKGEEYLVQYNKELPQCKLYKAGHHGSKTSSSEKLLSVIRPEYVCVCCCAGSTEYTDNGGNTFPTQDMLDRVLVYTRNIFVTSLADDSVAAGYVSFNGNIVVRSDGESFSVEGSNNSIPLPDTDWFKANRMPRIS